MKALNIVASAYRATLEEQDDPIVWLSHAMRGAGASIDLLLRDNAVNYAVRAQDASGLQFGHWRQTEPPRIAHDVASLIAKGAAVYALAEDLTERGLDREPLIDGIEPIGTAALAQMLGRYERVWHW